MNEMWTERYRPTEISKIVGNQDSVQEAVEWFESWEPGNDPLLLYGPPGVGKTALAQALAEENGCEIYLIDASDDRTKGTLEQKVLVNVQSMGMMGEDRVVIVDEADNLHGGGTQAINKAIDKATERLILIANDYWDEISRSIRDKCMGIEFEPVEDGEVQYRLIQIAQMEDIDITRDAIKKIVMNADGDVRGAVRDFESAAKGITSKRNRITEDRVLDYFGSSGETALAIGNRDVNESDVRSALESEFADGVPHDRWVIRGMPGFDLVAAEFAVGYDVKIHLRMPLPYDTLTSDWDEHSRTALDAIMSHADVVTHVFEDDVDYTEYAKWLVRDIDCVVAWIDDMDSRSGQAWVHAHGVEKTNLVTS